MGEGMSKGFDLLLGRKTYEIFAAHWRTSQRRPGRRAFQQRRQARCLAHAGGAEWSNSQLLEDEVAARCRG